VRYKVFRLTLKTKKIIGRCKSCPQQRRKLNGKGEVEVSVPAQLEVVLVSIVFGLWKVMEMLLLLVLFYQTRITLKMITLLLFAEVRPRNDSEVKLSSFDVLFPLFLSGYEEYILHVEKICFV
jgi:hypothetical protein